MSYNRFEQILSFIKDGKVPPTIEITGIIDFSGKEDIVLFSSDGVGSWYTIDAELIVHIKFIKKIDVKEFNFFYVTLFINSENENINLLKRNIAKPLNDYGFVVKCTNCAFITGCNPPLFAQDLLNNHLAFYPSHTPYMDGCIQP